MIETVGQLIEELEKYPKDKKLLTVAFDGGGYDAIYTTDVKVADNLSVFFGDNSYFQEAFKDRLYIGGLED
jgi:hypothetical protein